MRELIGKECHVKFAEGEKPALLDDMVKVLDVADGMVKMCSKYGYAHTMWVNTSIIKTIKEL